MRTATPLVTLPVTTVLASSATSAAISTPRTMGPGCVTIVSGPSRRARSLVSPHSAVYSRSEGTNEPLRARPGGAGATPRLLARLPHRGRWPPRPASPRGRGEQAARGDQGHTGAEGVVGEHRRSGHARVADVAHDQHREALEAAGPELARVAALALGEHLADREAVEQRLGRVLVPPVAGVDHPAAFWPSGPLGPGRGRGVAHDHGVDAHGLNGFRRCRAGSRPFSPTKSTPRS